MNPNHIALIGFPRPDLGLVDVLVAGEEDVPRPQLIGAPLNDVGDIPREEEENLVKLVLVVLHLGRDPVQIVVAFEQAVLHGLARCKGVKCQTH